MRFSVIIAEDCCIGCGQCADICGTRVFEEKDDTFVAAYPQQCVACMSCMDVCPEKCVTVKPNFGDK